MGLGCDDDVVVDDSDAGSGGNSGGGSIACSICLEAVSDNGDRSWAKLQCGHQFHLDCIGSAFNVKGAMQCPNCRKIEKGQWLYANGSRSLPEFSMEDWNHDEDLYDLSYSEMSFGVHWCPFGSIARVPSSFEDGEFSSTAYHELLGQHAIFAEQTAVSSASHPCPYIAYFGPVHPSSSNSNGSVSEAPPSFNGHWNGASVPSDLQGSYPFPAMDMHYHNWEHHSPPFSTTSTRMGNDQPSSQRPTRATSDMNRSGGSFMHPFVVGHGSSARAGSSVISSMMPPYPGSNARNRDRVQALQAYYQQQPNNMRTSPVVRRSTSHRGGSAQSGPVASSSDQNGGFYFFPPGSSGRTFQDPENPLPSRYQTWERELMPSIFSSHPPERDPTPAWGPFHQPPSASESSLRSSGGFRQRHGSDRTSSQHRS